MLSLPDGWRLTGPVGLLEEPLAGGDTAFRPFQVRSWRIDRAGPHPDR